MRINWAKIAVPQHNGSDTQALLQLLSKSNSITPYTPITKKQKNAVPRYFDGKVACVAPAKHVNLDDLKPARLNHSNIKQADRLLLKCWPTIHKQFSQIIRYLCPMEHAEQMHTLHSCSGCFQQQFGLIYTTVEHPFSLAEALVHELAHHKLFALGVGIEKSKGLILNDPEKLYKSPVILDRKRPMTAVVHAQYSFIHILQLDLLLHRNTTKPEHLALIESLIDYTLPKMKNGLKEIKKHVQLDAKGEKWMNSFYTWSEAVIQEADQLMKQVA